MRHTERRVEHEHVVCGKQPHLGAFAQHESAQCGALDRHFKELPEEAAQAGEVEVERELREVADLFDGETELFVELAAQRHLRRLAGIDGAPNRPQWPG